MQFKLSTIVGLLAVTSPALAVDVVSSIDGFTVLAKDVQTTANSIELTNALSKISVSLPTYISQSFTLYTNHESKETIDRLYLLNNAESFEKNRRLAVVGETLAANQQQAACNSFTNVSCFVLK